MSTEQSTGHSVGYRTKDLDQAAFVWLQPGARLVEIRGSSERGSTIFFHFSLPISEPELHDLLFRHANGETVVEPQGFCAKQNKLRDLLHSSLARRGTRNVSSRPG